MRKIDLIGQTFGFLKVIKREVIKIPRSRTYWHCICVCGSPHKVEHGQLVKGGTKSCGCKSAGLISNGLKKGGYRANFICTWHAVKTSGKNRGYVWNISKKLFHELTQKNCFYCDAAPNNTYSARKTCLPYIYNGLDRIDNNVGYTIDNVVPCCKDCNAGKGTMTQAAFFERIKRIAIKHTL